MASSAKQEAAYFGRDVKEINYVVAEGFTSAEMAQYLALDKEEVAEHVLDSIPIFAVTSDVETGEAPLAVEFDVTIDPDGGVPTSWIFWDGEQGSPQQFTPPPWTVTYQNEGTYEARVTGTSAVGESNEFRSQPIEVLPPAGP